MKTNQVVIIAIALVIGLGAGYAYGKNSQAHEMDMQMSMNSGMDMGEHMKSMEKMAEMMKSGGMMIQDMGTKYNDESAVVKGKDMEMIGEKFLKESTATSTMDSSMQQMMHH